MIAGKQTNLRLIIQKSKNGEKQKKKTNSGQDSVESTSV